MTQNVEVLIFICMEYGFCVEASDPWGGSKRIMWALTCNKEERHTLARYCYVKVKYMGILIVTRGIVSQWVGTV